MAIGESHKPRSTYILSSSIIQKIKDVRKQYHSNNVHIVAIDRFEFKVEKNTLLLIFFTEKKHLIIIFIYLCRIAEGVIIEDKTIC